MCVCVCVCVRARSAGRWSVQKESVLLYHRTMGEPSHSWMGKLREEQVDYLLAHESNTLNPKPETLNLEPFCPRSIHLIPETRNSEPRTPNPEPRTPKPWSLLKLSSVRQYYASVSIAFCSAVCNALSLQHQRAISTPSCIVCSRAHARM